MKGYGSLLHSKIGMCTFYIFTIEQSLSALTAELLQPSVFQLPVKCTPWQWNSAWTSSFELIDTMVHRHERASWYHPLNDSTLRNVCLICFSDGSPFPLQKCSASIKMSVSPGLRTKNKRFVRGSHLMTSLGVRRTHLVRVYRDDVSQPHMFNALVTDKGKRFRNIGFIQQGNSNY